jgi:hypothetical protein
MHSLTTLFTFWVIYFKFMWPCIVTNFFVIKPNRCTNFTNLFCHETLHVSDSSSVHHQEFIYCILSNGICHTSFEQDQDGTAVPSSSCSKVVYKPVWHKPLLTVQWINSWWWTEELSGTWRISWQNEFVKLVHVVGFITKKVLGAILRNVFKQDGPQMVRFQFYRTTHCIDSTFRVISKHCRTMLEGLILYLLLCGKH